MPDSTCTISVEWDKKRANDEEAHRQERVVELSALRMEFMNWRWKIKMYFVWHPKHALTYIYYLNGTIGHNRMHAPIPPVEYQIARLFTLCLFPPHSFALSHRSWVVWRTAEIAKKNKIKNAWHSLARVAAARKPNGSDWWSHTVVSRRHAKCVELRVKLQCEFLRLL